MVRIVLCCVFISLAQTFPLENVLPGRSAYDLLGRENGPLRWFTLVLTGGLVRTLVFLPLILFGGLMGLYTVILVDFSPSESRPPFFAWKGGLLGVALALLFWFAGHVLGIVVGPALDIPALALGLACALLMSTWQRLSWDPAEAGATSPRTAQVVAAEEPPATTPTPAGTEQLVARKTAHGRPPVFSRQRVVRGLLLGYLLGFAYFFAVNKDVLASLLESVPLALVGGVLCGAWRFINWEPPHLTPQLFSRKGFWTGLVAGFVPLLCWGLALSYADLPRYTGLLKGLEYTRFLFFVLFIVGISALANAVAGSIAQYTLWRANHLPHRLLGAFGLVLIVIAFAFQAVQPAIDILNQLK